MTTSTNVLLLGAGGHALVCVEVLRSAGLTVTACLARDTARARLLERLEVDVVGRDDEMATHVPSRFSSVFVAVGDNAARGRLIAAVEELGGSLATAISSSAQVSPTAQVNPGALVMPGSVINAFASIDGGAIVNTGAVVEHECKIGALAHLAPNVALAGNVTVGEGALVGIGARVTPGRRIGAWATVGAGAVVVEDVPAGSTAVGVPARHEPQLTSERRQRPPPVHEA